MTNTDARGEMRDKDSGIKLTKETKFPRNLTILHDSVVQKFNLYYLCCSVHNNNFLFFHDCTARRVGDSPRFNFLH